MINPAGRSSFLLIGDHAGNLIPAALGTLGIDAQERARHIAWDIGIGALGPLLAEALDAVFIRQAYSRLVIDCNRDPAASDAIPEVSDGTPIPGNTGLHMAARAARVADIHAPYQQAIADTLAARDARGERTVLVALHSFTPAMHGVPRPWQIGVLHDAGAAGFARRMLAFLQAEPDLVVGDNEPYRMDLIDYTIPRHAYAAGRDYVEIELRQDLMTEDWLRRWTDLLARALRAADEGG